MVEKVAPSLVKTIEVKMHPKDKSLTQIKAVDYSAIPYLLVNSVKELYAKVMRHDSDIARLKTEVQALQQSSARAPASVKAEHAEIARLKAENAALKSWACAQTPRPTGMASSAWVIRSSSPSPSGEQGQD